MKNIIRISLVLMGLGSCSETVDTSKYKEELNGRKIKHLTAGEIISFGHKEALNIAKDTAFVSSKLVHHINEAFTIEECKTKQEAEFFDMYLKSTDQLKEGVDLSNPVMKGDELLVVCPELFSDSTINVKYIYLHKAELIKKMPESY